MNWEFIITILAGIVVYFIAYRMGRYSMGKAGEEFFIRLMETLNEPGDKTVRQTIKIVLKYYKEWNRLRRFL